MNGKKLRLQRFRYPGKKTGLIIPIDHGLTVGPLSGLASVREIGGWIRHSAICGVIAHKGMAERLIEADLIRGAGLMVHLNGMTTLAARPDDKEPLTSVETALRFGADAVSLQVNFDGTNDAGNLRQIGQTVDSASRYGLPVLAMLYDKVLTDSTQEVARLRHIMRVAMELGCDAIKIAPPKSLRVLPELLCGIAEDISVFIAGGAATREDQVFTLARAAITAGAAGLCVGRNVFQRQDSSQVLDQLRAIVGSALPTLREVPFTAERVYGAH